MSKEKHDLPEEDSLIYYSSVNDNTEMNNSREHDLEYDKLKDD